MWEDLCYDCQQAAEKSLKSLLVSKKIVFPWTHFIGKLLELAEKSGLKVPPKVKRAIPLTEYAVASRYPGEYDPVQESDYLEAPRAARDVYEWAKRKMEARK